MQTINISPVLAALEAAGVKYDLTGECPKLEWIDGAPMNFGETFYGADLGIAVAPGVWAWYRISIDYDTCEAQYVTFRQRYNANVGAVLKSWKTECRVADQIQKLTGVNMRTLELRA